MMTPTAQVVKRKGCNAPFVQRDLLSQPADKIAFLILAHNDPNMLHTLVLALDNPKFDIYIHVDAKVDIENYNFSDYRLQYSSLHIMKDRYKVYWGGYSIVSATLSMYRAAMAQGGYLRYVTLSGNDYPLKSQAEIYDCLCDIEKEYIAGNPAIHDHKVRNFYFFDKGKLGKYISFVLRKLKITHNVNPLIVNGSVYTVYFAPQWHALSHACITDIIQTFDSNPQIHKYFKYSYAPDELLIPTLVFNSAFKEHCICSNFPAGTHYNQKPAIHCINYEPDVQVFDERDYDMLINSGKLFARKLRSQTSAKLIDKLRHNWESNTYYLPKIGS